jgi:hypothetical protein
VSAETSSLDLSRAGEMSMERSFMNLGILEHLAQIKSGILEYLAQKNLGILENMLIFAPKI